MPKYTWENLKEHPITPGYSVARGRVIAGEMICVMKNIYDSQHKDGKGIGANQHCHPEEMWIIITKGECEFREGDNEWDTLKVGDVHFIPPYVMHEVRAPEPYEFIAIKNLINGHSIYHTTWEPGAEEAWKNVVAAYDESKKFPNNDPWFEGSGR